jgi:hypothetical protein
MSKQIIAIGLDPACVDLVSCLLNGDDAAEAITTQHLKSRRFDCVVIGAGLRDSKQQMLLFERVINTIHKQAPNAKICFNSTLADTAEAVQRWV